MTSLGYFRGITVVIRLGLLVACSILALAICGAGGGIGIRKVSESVVILGQEKLVSANILGDIRSLTSDLLQYSLEVAPRETEAYAQVYFKNALKRKRQAAGNLILAMNKFETIPRSPEESEAWQIFKASMKPWRECDEQVTKAIEALAENFDESKNRELFSNYKIYINDWGFVQSGVEKNLSKLIAINLEAGKRARESGVEAQQTARRYMMVSLGAGMLVLIAIAIKIVRGITGPLFRLKQCIVAVSESKNFTMRSEVGSQDEIGQTADAFNHLLESTGVVLKENLTFAKTLSSAAHEAYEHSLTHNSYSI